MEEVIFSGTQNKKALGMSEVALIIENNENILPIDYKEVALTRRLFRSGESDYLLNRIPCRLLDITNLLMDTGLGQGAYSVMEQGMIDEIVSEKTDNRRRILEEAAGITKYKTRRRSTWNRLEATQADLTRIEDIIAEVKRQVDYLQRQVGRARKYQEQKQELDDSEVLLGRYVFFELHGELSPLQEELAKINRNSESSFAEFAARESSLEKSRIPVIVAINGACVGGGVDMISACDIRYATKDAFFCIQETNLGLVADVGTLQRLPKLIPEGIVRELALTGRKLRADEAEKFGLISEIFDDQESMLNHAMDMAREIASKSPLAISGIKEVINYSRDHSVDESLNYVALWNAAMKYEDDLKETFIAKMEKREEKFEGLKKKGKYFEK